MASASTVMGQNSKAMENFPSSSHQKPQALPTQPPQSKLLRLKLTKPRPPRSNPQEVDWDEDLRPTPNEIVEAKANHGRSGHAHTDPKRPKTNDKKTGNKREKSSKPRTASAKRRKSNPIKSTTTKGQSDGPQLPLITLAASAIAATINQDKPPAPDRLKDQSNNATTNRVDLPKASHQTSPANGSPNQPGKSSPQLNVKIERCTSVAGESLSSYDHHAKVSSHSQMVNILEYKASAQQKSNDKAPRMISDTSSSCGGDAKQTARGDFSRITILESRALPQGKTIRPKAIREKSTINRGRAQSVGNKLILALHENDDTHPDRLIKNNTPIIISSDPVDAAKVMQTKQPDSVPVPTKKAPNPVEAERTLNKAVWVDDKQRRFQSRGFKSSSPVVVDDTKETEVIDVTGGMASWGSFLDSLGHSERSSTGYSSDMESDRGLMDDGPSILDYHMETEHLSGFAALQPIRSGPTTSSQVTRPCESQAPSSSKTSALGKTIESTATRIERHQSSHTPESQKPLLPHETAVTENCSPSPHQPKSVSRTTIVDRNGSPRLLPQSAKTALPPQVDVDREKSYEPRVTDTSPSQYSRSSSEQSTESQYEGVIWTKFQRDMFLAYGIETEKMARSHAWPPRPKHQPSFSEDVTVDGAKSDRASPMGPHSSERTIEERGLGAPLDQQFDRSFRTEISESTQSDMKSHRSSDEDPMEWISTLQVAQKDAHNLLSQTNAVSPRFQELWGTNSVIDSVNSTGCRESDHHTGPRSLPTRVWSNPGRFVPGPRSTHAFVSAANATGQRTTC